MTTRRKKKWAVALGSLWGAMATLVGSDSVRAESVTYDNHLSFTGSLSYMTTVYPFTATTNDIKNGFSKLFIQAMKDDAAAYIATNGDLDGPMLESAWRTYLEQHADRQPSKKEFAHLVLATYG
ncbi:hypothetical protein PS662_02632 [Pseudomonas fluorescens]|uniref:DUF2388 domain-containing protein n=1 Tax=Pseudomonas fluorescens TaxID=294 RepID=A0A5E6T195_PSEFL|nr:DUF2388 domain-containing protein [Pseudomonas fluorescens]VVM87139.1 hypothetical protein PS662_02632 [Pseudomonas fluorescens]